MQDNRELHVVTGAFGYSGRYITERLLRAGYRVRTLTNSPDREHPFGNRVEVHPFNFDHPERITSSLEGAQVLYFRGKALIEHDLRESGLSYAILRPAVLFGGEDILINNIAWVLRHLPIFGVFGAGHYRLQPIHVHDFADLAVAQGVERADRIIDAIGPETYSYRELVRELARIIGVRRPIVSVPPQLGYAAGWLLGKLLGDVLITRDEVEGLMQDLLATESKPTGRTKLSSWAWEHAATLGRRYATELGRRRNRRVAYANAK